MRLTAPQVLLGASTVLFSWNAMMVVHEAGHVAHLWATGGTVDQLVLHPLKISHTVPGENPHPLVVAIGGPIWGMLLPLLLWATVSLALPSRAYLARFFAGFCLVANGAYLAGDAWLQGGDGRQLVLHGLPPWSLPLAGLPAVAAGLALWNGLGVRFGLGQGNGQVRNSDALLMATLAVTLLLAELLAAAWRPDVFRAAPL